MIDYGKEIPDGFIIKRIGKCQLDKCGAACCKFFMINAPIDKGYEKYYEGFFPECNEYGDRFLSQSCKFLQKNNKCSLWNDNNFPEVCKQFPNLTDNVYRHIAHLCTFKFIIEPIEKEDK